MSESRGGGEKTWRGHGEFNDFEPSFDRGFHRRLGPVSSRVVLQGRVSPNCGGAVDGDTWLREHLQKRASPIHFVECLLERGEHVYT